MDIMPLFASGLEVIKKRFPKRSEILSIFNVLLFVLFGWSIRGFLFEIPAFLLYMGLGDITAILFYMMAFALLETIFFTIGLVILSTLLPSNWLKNGFAYKGFLIILVATIGCILFQGYYKIGFFQNLIKNDYSVLQPLWVGLITSFIGLYVLFWLFNNKPQLQKYLLILIEQFSIFGYIYFPLGVIGILVVFFRNII
jgi:hypothetical protein